MLDDSGGKVTADDAVRRRLDRACARRHVLTFRVETVGKDDERFTSAVETTVVVMPWPANGPGGGGAGRRTGGDIAYAWKRKRARHLPPRPRRRRPHSSRNTAPADDRKTARAD
ncbi:MAG: hypothetical protein HS111_34465 [Kofleriaceae bacterium]|nr:hypothetical protein [Kofleriaceae bacterium]